MEPTVLNRDGDRSSDDACSALASVLWREREILDRVLFALTVEQLVLRAGETRWLADADEDMRTAMDRLSHCEVVRAMEVEDLAARLGLSPESTLRELALVAPEPWATLFAEHRDGLLTLTAQIADAAAENRVLLESSVPEGPE